MSNYSLSILNGLNVGVVPKSGIDLGLARTQHLRQTNIQTPTQTRELTLVSGTPSSFVTFSNKNTGQIIGRIIVISYSNGTNTLRFIKGPDSGTSPELHLNQHALLWSNNGIIVTDSLDVQAINNQNIRYTLNETDYIELKPGDTDDMLSVSFTRGDVNVLDGDGQQVAVTITQVIQIEAPELANLFINQTAGAYIDISVTNIGNIMPITKTNASGNQIQPPVANYRGSIINKDTGQFVLSENCIDTVFINDNAVTFPKLSLDLQTIITSMTSDVSNLFSLNVSANSDILLINNTITSDKAYTELLYDRVTSDAAITSDIYSRFTSNSMVISDIYSNFVDTEVIINGLTHRLTSDESAITTLQTAVANLSGTTFNNEVSARFSDVSNQISVINGNISSHSSSISTHTSNISSINSSISILTSTVNSSISSINSSISTLTSSSTTNSNSISSINSSISTINSTLATTLKSGSDIGLVWASPVVETCPPGNNPIKLNKNNVYMQFESGGNPVLQLWGAKPGQTGNIFMINTNSTGCLVTFSKYAPTVSIPSDFVSTNVCLAGSTNSFSIAPNQHMLLSYTCYNVSTIGLYIYLCLIPSFTLVTP